MRRNALMACLLVALAAPMPVLADGVIRFGGRIVEAPCAPSAPSAHEVVLSGCPIAAEGSTLSIVRFGHATGVRLVDLGSGLAADELSMDPAAIPAGRRDFSSRYRIDSASHGPPDAYMIRIDYL